MLGAFYGPSAYLMRGREPAAAVLAKNRGPVKSPWRICGRLKTIAFARSSSSRRISASAASPTAIDEAARYVPLENLAISPQCGMASAYLGNPISADDQRRKLELVMEIADEVWG